MKQVAEFFGLCIVGACGSFIGLGLLGELPAITFSVTLNGIAQTIAAALAASIVMIAFWIYIESLHWPFSESNWRYRSWEK